MNEPTPPKGSGLWARLFPLRAGEPEPEAPPPPPAEPPADDVATLPPPSAEVEDVVVEVPPPPPPEALAPEAPPMPCACCGTPRKGKLSYCEDCGWVFPADNAPAAARVDPVSSLSPNRDPAMPPPTKARLKDRYEIGEQTNERLGVRRFRGR